MRGNVVGLVGGLGNQLFQYSFARWLELRTPYPSSLDLSAYRNRRQYLSIEELPVRRLHRERIADLVPHPLGRVPRSAEEVRRAFGPRKIVRETDLASVPSVGSHVAPAWYYGYWQHPAIVDDVIDAIRDEMWRCAAPSEREPIAVHVRRGDMVGHGSVLSPTFYLRALRALRAAHDLEEATEVAVYSDDPAWCREMLSIPRARYVPAGNAAEDLMALAGHRFLVLSGSTFSWWASRLRPRAQHEVVAPRPFSMVPGQRLEQAEWLPVRRDPACGRP
jgi:hypothetical protein